MEKKRQGDSDQITREYFDSLLLEMRHLDGCIPDTTFELYGEKFQTPIMMAALSHLNNIHEDGMVEMAKGAALAEAVNWAGMGEKDELERITATGAKTIKIIKPYADNDLILERIAHAKECGVLAVGMDIDHAFNGKGEYDKVLGYDMAPKSQEEIRRFVESTSLPFVVNGQIPIFVDCGIMSGMDVFKALALGASAVSAGRVIMPPLKEKGAQGVKELVCQMSEELKGVMARTGCPDLQHIDPSVIWQK